MKVLFVGDYSNFHVTLARELSRRGHEVCVASDGSGVMGTVRDVDLRRGSGLMGSFRYLHKVFDFVSHAKGYDVVQIINPNFLQLRTGKIRYFFNELKRNNGSIFLSLAGTDPVIVRGCCESEMLRYSEFRVGEELSDYARKYRYVERRWMAGDMGDYCRFVYENVDGAMSALYEYHKLAAPYLGDKLRYVGIPVDTKRFEDVAMPSFGRLPLTIFVGVKSELELFKGLDRLTAAAKRVEARCADRCKVVRVQDLPYEEYMKALSGAHVVIDQLYSYTPATNALAAMAAGKLAVSGGEEEFYHFIGEDRLRPVVNVVPGDDALIESTLESLVMSSPEELEARSLQGREFVRKHNDVAVVADRFERYWAELLERK